MARGIHREIFKRHNEFIVVRPLKITKAYSLEPGDVIDKSKFRTFHLRSLYQRRRIGVLGSPWAVAMLKDLDNAHARPEVTGTKKELTPIFPGYMDEVQKIGSTTISINDFTELALACSELTVDDWNELDEFEMDEFYTAAEARLLKAQEEDDPADVKKPEITKDENNKWVIEGYPDEVFKTKKAAAQWWEKEVNNVQES